MTSLTGSQGPPGRPRRGRRRPGRRSPARRAPIRRALRLLARVARSVADRVLLRLGVARPDRPPGPTRRRRRRGAAAPAAAATALPLPAPEQPLASLAERLDLGVSRLVPGPRTAFDIPSGSTEALLAALVDGSAARGQAAWIRYPGVMERLERAGVAGHARSARGQRWAQVLTADSASRLREAIPLRPWRRAQPDTWQSLDPAAPVYRFRSSSLAQLSPRPLQGAPEMPIDAVYLWVNGADPAWLKLLSRYRDPSTIEPERYQQVDELRYSMRSLAMYAPWLRRIHVLSNCAPPAWFIPSERFVWVDHAEVMPPELLPTFNSTAIETWVHRIPGLTEHFVYLNDDMVLWAPVTPSMYFTRDGRSIANMSPIAEVVEWEQRVAAGEALSFAMGVVNAAHLFQERFGYLPTRTHAHAEFALRRSVMERMEAEFAEPLAANRAQRFRHPDDANFVAFLYHHVADATGGGVLGSRRSLLLRASDHQRKVRRGRLRDVTSICLNDGRGSTQDQAYQRFKLELLERWMPLACDAER